MSYTEVQKPNSPIYDNLTFFDPDYYPFLDTGHPFERLGSYAPDSTSLTDIGRPANEYLATELLDYLMTEAGDYLMAKIAVEYIPTTKPDGTIFTNLPFFDADYFPFLDTGTPFSRLGAYMPETITYTEVTKPS